MKKIWFGCKYFYLKNYSAWIDVSKIYIFWMLYQIYFLRFKIDFALIILHILRFKKKKPEPLESVYTICLAKNLDIGSFGGYHWCLLGGKYGKGEEENIKKQQEKKQRESWSETGKINVRWAK